ncbi:MAG: allantoate amidohydrolase [bacterium]
MWADLLPVGRDPRSGGYRRFAWTDADRQLREWFAAEARRRGLDLIEDRGGNQWAWWGDPDAAVRAGDPGIAVGSHLDSVPDGGAFDGPLGVVSGFAAVDALRADGFAPRRPVAVAAFAEEEGARFGLACAGSRLLTGGLDPGRALGRRDDAGITLAEALAASGRDPADTGRDDVALDRVSALVELHVEQGRGLVDLGAPVGVGTGIWPHGRWRVDLPGRADHAGTTALGDRHDPMISLAQLVLMARAAAVRHRALATCAKVAVQPNAVNAIPSQVTAWLDARAADEAPVRAVVADVAALVARSGGRLQEESWTPATAFPTALVDRLADCLPEGLGDAPRLATGAGHDAGVLAAAGVPTAMLFVRNPSGVSHSPAEHAEPADCRAGVAALTAAVRELAG